jgi:hypothetical protein
MREAAMGAAATGEQAIEQQRWEKQPWEQPPLEQQQWEMQPPGEKQSVKQRPIYNDLSFSYEHLQYIPIYQFADY